MTARLAYSTRAADIAVIAATAAAFPPSSVGLVPAAWGSVDKGVVPEFDAELFAGAAASGALTDVYLYGATLETGVIADTTFTAANATEIFTANSHGMLTGDGPVQVSNAGGALPAGLVAATDYYVIRINANTFYLATSRANAWAGTKVSITSDGTGTQTLADVSTTELVKWSKHGLLATSVSFAAREGLRVRCDHNPKIIAYAFVWTGTASSAPVGKIHPVFSR